MQLTVQKPKKPGYAIFIVCLILAIVGIFFLVLPKYDSYKQAKAQAAATQQTLDDVKQQQQIVSNLLNKLKQKSADLQKVDQALPDQADIPDFYAYIESLAKSVNLTINTIQAKDSADEVAKATPGTAGGALPAGAGSAGAAVTPAGAAGAPQAAGARTLSPTIGKIDMDLQLTGTMDSYTAFLAKLQDSLRLIDVQSIDIAAAQGKSDLTFITSLSSYYQKSK